MVRYNIKASGKLGHPDMNMTVEQKSVIIGLVELYLEIGYPSIILSKD